MPFTKPFYLNLTLTYDVLNVKLGCVKTKYSLKHPFFVKSDFEIPPLKHNYSF